MKKTENVKGHGYFRKTSIGLVCGIALTGAFFLGANGVSADEATAPTTATPNTTATANESKTVTVDEGLTETANKAKEAGLTVNAEPTKNIGTANTEAEATKLDGQAKKEVADQKAEIEKTVADYQKAKSTNEAQEKEVVKSIVNDTTAYQKANNGLKYLEDKDFISGKTSFGEITSNKGSVSYVAPSTTSVMMDDPATMRNFINNSQVGTTPTEMTIGYQNEEMLIEGSPIANKKTTTKVIPVFLREGEIVAYDVNVTPDSELGSLGVAKIQKQFSLDKSPVQNNGKFVTFLSQQGSTGGQALMGGSGKTTEVLKEGDWTYTISYHYFDKNNNKIPLNELFAKYSNKYLLNGKELVKPSDVTKNSEVDTVQPPFKGNGFSKVKTVHIHGGEIAQYVVTETEKISGLQGINPIYYVGSHSVKAPTPVDTSKLTSAPTAPTVNYHLVSYTVNKPKATNNPDTVKKGSIVQVFVDESGKEIAPKTNTGEKPVNETVKLTHPNEITFEGKTYTFTKQDKVDPTKIPNGTETITYVYKLKETPKPVEKPTPKPVEKPTPVPTPTPKPTPAPTPVPAPVEKPTTIHIDTNGKPVAPKEDGTKPFKTIDGYEPAPKDSKNVENPKGETVRVYNVIKKGNVEVRYVKDDASRTVLKEPVADTVGAKVGSDYDTTDHKPVTITKDGVTYELVRSEGVEKGKVVEGKTVVTYVYREVQKPVTIHIDTEGNPVAPQEDGTKPFKEIEGYKPAPKDSKNVEDPKGVTVRVYEKVKPEAPQEAPKTPEQPQKPQGQQPATQTVATKQLPNTGSEASTALAIAGLGVLGLGALAYKKKEN